MVSQFFSALRAQLSFNVDAGNTVTTSGNNDAQFLSKETSVIQLAAFRNQLRASISNLTHQLILSEAVIGSVLQAGCTTKMVKLPRLTVV
jgi:hypothetical protein